MNRLSRRVLARGCSLLLLSLMACAHGNAQRGKDTYTAVDEATARAVLGRFTQGAQQSTEEILDLYADEARVRTLRHLQDGSVRELELSGKQVKALMGASLGPEARLGVDTFSDINITALPQGTRVSAKRYSPLKCTLDPSYYLVVARDAQGKVRIIEERSETWAVSQCGLDPNKPLEARLGEVVGVLRHVVPLKLDEDTQLSQAGHSEDELWYLIHLVSVTADEIDVEVLLRELSATARRECCTRQPQRGILDAGGRITYRYTDRDGRMLGSVEITHNDCGPSS